VQGSVLFLDATKERRYLLLIAQVGANRDSMPASSRHLLGCIFNGTRRSIGRLGSTTRAARYDVNSRTSVAACQRDAASRAAAGARYQHHLTF
jgi:hypothetical protein